LFAYRLWLLEEGGMLNAARSPANYVGGVSQGAVPLVYAGDARQLRNRMAR